MVDSLEKPTPILNRIDRTFAFRIVRSQRLRNGITHGRKLICDGVPHNLVVNPVLSVSQDVSYPSKALPVRAWRYHLRIIAQRNCSFGHYL
jgi:hypothetical protein